MRWHYLAYTSLTSSLYLRPVNHIISRHLVAYLPHTVLLCTVLGHLLCHNNMSPVDFVFRVTMKIVRHLTRASPPPRRQYQYRGSTVTGKLALKIKNGDDTKQPAWIVTPSDRRRKNEEIPESALGKIINAQQAAAAAAAMTTTSSRGKRSNESPTSLSNTSDGSSDEVPKRRSSDRGPSPRSSCDDNNSEEDGGSSSSAAGKRKVDDAHNITTSIGNERSKKTQKTVTFSQESDVTGTTTASRKKKTTTTTSKSMNSKVTSSNTNTRIVTRSTRGSGEAVLLPELPMKKKVSSKGKKVAKDENVTVVKMLTGTLYLYRGDRPRAEFVRYK